MNRPVSDPGWQVLGELQLTAGSDVHDTVDGWLAVLLSQLELDREFVNKVLRSAQEATGRILQTTHTTGFEHLQLLVFVPTDRRRRRKCWGFFRIEKVEAEMNQVHPAHAIEFYLYLEGN